MKKLLYLIIFALLINSCTKAETIDDKGISRETFTGAGLNVVDPWVPAPDFTLQDLNGETHSLSEYRGEIVFLNFWATWCGPCRSEMPAINNLYDSVKNSNVKVIAVNIGEDFNTVKSYVDGNSINFDILLDTRQSVAGLYAIRSIPTTYVIDKEGNIIAGKLGAYSWDNPKVVDLLKKLAE